MKMVLSASDRIDRFLSGGQDRLFDFVNNPAFFLPRLEDETEYTSRLRATAKMLYIAANETSGGVGFRFRSSSMSNGYKAYELAEDYSDRILDATEARFGEAFLTTQSLGKYVATSEMLNRVILPHREVDYKAANRVEARFPEDGIQVPIEAEHGIRIQRSNPALSQGATFQDRTYEMWWVPRVLDSIGYIYGGDRPYSRYANMEDLTGDLIQCGLRDADREHVGPGTKFDITDEHGNPVPFADRAWARAQHIVDVVERGFRSDLAVASLVVQFQLDDWLRNGDGPIDLDKVHPILRKRDMVELKQMDRLKEIMLPYIAQKCASWIPYMEDANLKAYFEKNILPLAGNAPELTGEEIKKELFAHHPVGGFVHPVLSSESAVGAAFKSASAPHVEKPAKRRSNDGNFFKSPSALFDDGHFDKLDLWEQAALPFLMGAMESFRLPESKPRTAFFSCEPKGGERALAFLEKHNVDTVREAQSAIDPNDPESFAKTVIEANREEALKDAGSLLKTSDFKARKVANVVSTLNMQNIAAAVEKNREFVAAAGSRKLSSRAFFALMQEWFDRNAEVFVMRKGWEAHQDEVQLAVRGVLAATGMIERPYDGGKYKMEMFVNAKKGSGKSLQKQDMYDLVTTLGKKVDSWLDKDVKAREHYVSMARLLQVLDMYADPGRMNYELSRDPASGATVKSEIIHWKNVDPHLMDFWDHDPAKKRELLALRETVREKLLTIGVRYFAPEDLNGLHEDYSKAWHDVHGQDSILRRGTAGQQVIHGWGKPSV